MKKSNKLTVFYVLSSVTLFLVLLLGGVYGVYVSVGLNFVRSTVPNPVGDKGLENVSFGGSVNYTPSMTGVILLSIILVVIAVFDFVSLIKQIVFFKQFTSVRNSKLEKKIEKKTTSKSGVIFWTFVIDILSFIAGISGLFINNRSFAGGNEMSWIFYLVDGLVSILSLVSIILLIAKLKNRKVVDGKKVKPIKQEGDLSNNKNKTQKAVNSKDINQIEYNLMKLDSMRKGKIVTEEEYKKLRRKILNLKKSENIFNESQKDY